MGRHAADSDTASAESAVSVLTVADLPALRLDDRVRLPEAAFAALLRSYPDRSVWIPATGEYAVVAPWRHRPELAVVEALVAFRHEPVLLQALMARTRAAGAAALILLDSAETRHPAFYARYGFELLERIQTYELTSLRRLPPQEDQQRLRFVRAAADDAVLLSRLLALDHEAFPWLWRNSEDEFRAYLAMPEVAVWAGMEGDQLRSYVGLTHFPGWGHLDRIAVARAVQRAGYGRESLAFAIQHVTAMGARRMALSTQGDNIRSQKLYEGMGFRRTIAHDYSVRGIVFDRARFEPSITGSD
ncbi:MAG: GNAT family N-acetyltransferase [Chloroflexota bacterium]|nr:GNAT family N-acetyltransferase [Chloroflexota bacterium]